MDYAKYYCKKDTEVLCKGYNKFRGWILQELKIDIDHLVTISSVAKAYLINEGFFEGVEKIGGMCQHFLRQFVVGGRVMTKQNKKVHVRCTGNMEKDLQDPESPFNYLKKRVKSISDYDAVSLYPSAMFRMPGFLKGKPKILEQNQLNKEFLKQ